MAECCDNTQQPSVTGLQHFLDQRTASIQIKTYHLFHCLNSRLKENQNHCQKSIYHCLHSYTTPWAAKHFKEFLEGRGQRMCPGFLHSWKPTLSSTWGTIHGFPAGGQARRGQQHPCLGREHSVSTHCWPASWGLASPPRCLCTPAHRKHKTPSTDSRAELRALLVPAWSCFLLSLALAAHRLELGKPCFQYQSLA